MDKTTQTNILKTINPVFGIMTSEPIINMDIISSTGNIKDYYGTN